MIDDRSKAALSVFCIRSHRHIIIIMSANLYLDMICKAACLSIHVMVRYVCIKGDHELHCLSIHVMVRTYVSKEIMSCTGQLVHTNGLTIASLITFHAASLWYASSRKDTCTYVDHESEINRYIKLERDPKGPKLVCAMHQNIVHKNILRSTQTEHG